MLAQKIHIVDLTQPIDTTMPVWPGDPNVEITPWSLLQQDGFMLQRLCMGEHTGTHIGAPYHFDQAGSNVQQIPLERLVAPAVKIRLSDGSDLLTRMEIDRWESIHGIIPKGGWLLAESGWSCHWPHKSYSSSFPGICPEAVRFLCATRQIAGIGIDTPGVDGSRSSDLAANRMLAQQGCLHLENLNHLEQLPDTGFWLFIGALPIADGSGSPCRVLAIMNEPS